MFDDWQREIERYFDQLQRARKRPQILFAQYPTHSPVWTPAVDVYETDTDLVVVADVAGADASQTDIRAEAGRLTLSGVRRERGDPSRDDEHRLYHALEISYGRFERTIPLPSGLDTTEAAATYRDGLLIVRLPKRAPHHVKIEVASESDPGDTV